MDNHLENNLFYRLVTHANNGSLKSDEGQRLLQALTLEFLMKAYITTHCHTEAGEDVMRNPTFLSFVYEHCDTVKLEIGHSVERLLFSELGQTSSL